jgi:acetoin utilization deacetylase AcuC-like enzyme
MKKIKVLFLAANPVNGSRVVIDEEIRSITKKIKSSEYRDSIEFVPALAARSSDLIEELNLHKPQIVHFSAFEETTGELLLLDRFGTFPKPVEPNAIQTLFETTKDTIRVVFLNACYSQVQVQAIVKDVDCVIGIKNPITNQAAINFAASFYRAIGFGQSIKNAFDQGRVAYEHEGISKKNFPELLLKKGVDPSQLLLVEKRKTLTKKTGSQKAQHSHDSARSRRRRKKTKILIFSANPKATSRMRFDEEIREIEDGLLRAKHRNRFKLKSLLAVRYKDLRRGLLEYKPHIVHFIGHGNEEGLMIEDEMGNPGSISVEALSDLFGLFREHIESVILSACYSVPQASAISEHINFVIGMSDKIMEDADIEFSVGFYDALLAGETIERAFAFGTNAIRSMYPNYPAHLIPVLHKKKGQKIAAFQPLIDKGRKEQAKKSKKISFEKLKETAYRKVTDGLNNEDGYFFKKYITKVYQKRAEAEKEFSRFLKRIDKRCFIITGRAGKGKTSLLCHLSEQIILETKTTLILLNSPELNLVKASLKEYITGFFNTEQMTLTFNDIGECLSVEEAKLVVIIDAINELEGEKAFSLFNEQLTELFNIVKEKKYPVLFCISCRSEFWPQFSDKNWVKDNIFEPRDGFENTTHELQDFEESKIDAIITEYFQWYSIKGKVIGDARLSCCDPIMLRYLCEAHTNRKSNDKTTSPEEIKTTDIGVKTILQRKEVFRLFASNIRERMFERVKKVLGLKDDKDTLFKLTTHYLIHLAKFMMDNGQSHFTIEKAYDVAQKIKHPDGDLERHEFYNKDRRSVFFMFIDEGIILDKRGDRTYDFVFESYFEYSLGRHFALHEWPSLRGEKGGPKQVVNPEEIKINFKKLLELHNKLMKEKNFTNLLGALEYAVLVIEANEDYEGYRQFPELFIELIEIMMETEQFIFRQKAFAILRETQLLMGYDVEDKEKKLQRVFNIFYKLTKKVDFVISWDLEHTISQLSKYEADFVIDRMEAWAEEGEKVQPMFAAQVLARISIANPKKVIDVLLRLSELDIYRENFWLARSLVFAARELGMNAKKVGLESEYIKKLRYMLRNLYGNKKIPDFTRGLAMSVLPYFSDMNLIFLEKILGYVKREKYTWAIWNLAYELREWIKPFKGPCHDSAWIWDILNQIVDLDNPHLNYAVYKAVEELELENSEKTDEILERVEWNRWVPGRFNGEYEKTSNELTGIVYSPVYLEPSFNNHIECRERLEGILEKLINVGEEHFNWVTPMKAKPWHLHPVHNEKNDRHRDGSKWPGYLDEVKKASEIFTVRSNSINIPVGPSELRYESYDVALISVGGVISAVDYVLDNPARAAWSMGRPPGHLANNKICIFNNIAVGAYHAKKKYGIKRIFIVDCDAHHGKHTHWVFRRDPEVIYFSIHIDGDYAKEEGKISDIGQNEGEGYNFNFPYPENMGDDGYREIVDQLLIPVAEEFKPELIMISAGFDGHFEDFLTPRCILSEYAYIHLAKKLKNLAIQLDIKIVGAFEGGYGLQSLANSFVHMISVIGEWDVPPEKIGFVPGKDKHEVDDIAIKKVRYNIKERVKLMKKVKEEKPCYTLFCNMKHWNKLLNAHGKKYDKKF